jgi:hypothetical protein
MQIREIACENGVEKRFEEAIDMVYRDHTVVCLKYRFCDKLPTIEIGAEATSFGGIFRLQD